MQGSSFLLPWCEKALGAASLVVSHQRELRGALQLMLELRVRTIGMEEARHSPHMCHMHKKPGKKSFFCHFST